MSTATLPVTRVGWPLLPVPGADGRLAWPAPEASVRELIEVALRTRPGEQLMRPGFGAGLEELVDAPNTLATRRQIRDLVAGALARWEGRVDVDRVEVWEVPGRPTHVRVEVAYRIRRTGQAAELAFGVAVGG